MPSGSKTPPTALFWIFLASGIVASIILAAVSIAFSLRIDNIRCFTANGISVLPVPVTTGGFSAGKIVLSATSVESQIRWWTTGEPTRISYRGPLNVSGVNASMIAPYALTLCGGNNTPSCKLLEMGTCFERELGDDCGLIELVSWELDTGDVEIDDDFFNITGFVSLAKSSPHLFYLSIEVGGEEVQRGSLGAICTRDHI